MLWRSISDDSELLDNLLFTTAYLFLSYVDSVVGSGKTAAFLIPILSRIFEEGPPPPPDVSFMITSLLSYI